jgi:hypothetical protein
MGSRLDMSFGWTNCSAIAIPLQRSDNVPSRLFLLAARQS